MSSSNQETAKSPPKGSPTGSPPKGSPVVSPVKGSPTGSPAKGSAKGSPILSPKKGSKSIVASEEIPATDVPLEDDEEYYTRPDFIYGGPFIAVNLPSAFFNTATPMNVPLQGTYKKSFAYFSLKDRLPVILTKIIDQLSRDGQKIKSATGASDEDVKSFMQAITQLKNDLVTNKTYAPLTLETSNAKKWNEWISNQDIQKYFNNSWLFSESYVYRRLKEACELTKGLTNFDYFEDQKNKSFDENVELMCIVADRMVIMVNKSDKEKRKNDFITLLKLSLWSNKCDLSLSLGEQVNVAKDKEAADKVAAEKAAVEKAAAEKLAALKGPEKPTKKGKKEARAAAAPPAAAAGAPHTNGSDPFQMIIDFKDKVLVDDSSKIADQIITKSEAMSKAVDGNTTFKFKCSCHRLAALAGLVQCKEEVPPEPPKEVPKEVPKEEGKEENKEEKKEEPPKQIPCPAKMTIPQTVMFDIVCDNAGYELFADLCLAHFLIAQKIVRKVRFHVKNMPWYVSDVTVKDFQYVIDACANSTYVKEPTAEPPEGAPAENQKVVNSEHLKQIGQQWQQYFKDGVFVVMAEDYWTYPHSYKDMKKYDYQMYRKLQYAVAVLFKGDLNYRKLLADRNCNPTITFEAGLQGFTPAPLIALRTVKSEVICGLPKGKWDLLTKQDEKWMQTGDYGVIQYYPKGEPLKVADRPCMDYCETCFGVICPEHTDI